MIINNYQSSSTYKNKTIIFLRGTACSGKSTTAQLLGNNLNAPFLIFSLEDLLFFHMVPKEYLVNGKRSKEGYSIQRDEKGNITNVTASEWASEIYSLHASTLEIYTKAHLNIICDGNFINEHSFQLVLSYVPEDYNIYIFTLEVPLPILEQREKLRTHERTIGFAKHQKELCDKWNLVSDLVIHVKENTTPQEITDEIIDYYKNNSPHQKLQILERLKI